MGFGMLFVGYILTFLFVLTPFGYFFKLLGTALMAYSFTKLTEYNKSFKYAFFAAIPLFLIALVSTGINLAAMLIAGFVPNSVLLTVVSCSEAIFNLVFHVILLSAVADIAKETGVTKIRTAAYRNMIIYGLYFVLQLAILLPFISQNEMAEKIINLSGNIVWISWVVLIGIMLFSCYMRICDENDTEMNAKPSRFAFINKFRAEFERKETKAREDDKRYFNEKAEKRKNKKNKK